MKPNEAGRKAGLTQQDGQRIAKAIDTLADARDCFERLERCGESCEQDVADCAKRVEFGQAILAEFFGEQASIGRN
jgi:hypothetical protein